MTIITEYAYTSFNLLFLNQGSKPRRIWEFDNSWGWNTLTFKVYDLQNKTSAIKIKKLSTKGWTKNGPTFFEVDAGSRYNVPINLRDNDWEIPGEADPLKTKDVVVKVILDIPPSAEAKEFGVFVGALESNDIILNPPHKWL